MLANYLWEIPDSVLYGYMANKDLVVKIMSETEFFHGTGSMNYTSDWWIEDTVNRILEDWIIPNDERLSEFFWISTRDNICITRMRVYARIYADMFDSWVQTLKHTFWTNPWWIYLLAKEMIKESIPSIRFWEKALPRTWKWFRAEYESSEWNKESKSSKKYWLYKILYWKSDIKDNFPVVYGIKKWADIKLEYPDLLWFRLF